MSVALMNSEDSQGVRVNANYRLNSNACRSNSFTPALLVVFQIHQNCRSDGCHARIRNEDDRK